MGKEKKEIWMEKLIELLNEYGTQEEIKWKWYFVPNHIQWEWCDNSECSDLLIISKKFWFIKWLVENDKIDYRKLDYKNIYMSDYWSSDDIFLAYNKGEQWIIYTVDYYESLLMLLSISDTPIEDLLLYLK